MIDRIKKMLGIGSSIDLAELISNGAIILDVRTKGEYDSGHVKGSINIPLNQLENNLSKLQKEKTIITCCASGMRSSAAKSQLKNRGFLNVYNGGGWMSINKYKSSDGNV